MKTVKELRNIFIESSMHNYRVDSSISARKQGVFVSVQPKINVYFCEFIEEKIYKGRTTFDYLKKIYGKKFEPTEEYCLKNNIPVEEVKKIINSGETERRINSYFEKYRIELNNILESNN